MIYGPFQQYEVARVEPVEVEEKPKPIKVAEYLESENISPVEEIIKLMPDLPPEMQAMMWREILKRVDPLEKPQQPQMQTNIINESGGKVPQVIRQTHSEEELTRIASSTGYTDS